MITIGRQRVEEEVEEEQRALDNWRKWESIRAQEAGPFMVWRSLRRFFGETTNRRNPVIFFSNTGLLRPSSHGGVGQPGSTSGRQWLHSLQHATGDDDVFILL
jgi:hypothetical protein